MGLFYQYGDYCPSWFETPNPRSYFRSTWSGFRPMLHEIRQSETEIRPMEPEIRPHICFNFGNMNMPKIHPQIKIMYNLAKIVVWFSPHRSEIRPTIPDIRPTVPDIRSLGLISVPKGLEPDPWLWSIKYVIKKQSDAASVFEQIVWIILIQIQILIRSDNHPLETRRQTA